MTAPDPDPAALRATLLLDALTWVLSDDDRARRFLDLTGLDPQQLRGMMGTPALDAAVARFLAAHEPDLIACAQALSLPPATFAAILKGRAA